MALANGLGSTKLGTGTTVGTSTPTSRAGYGDYNKAKAMAKEIAIKTGNSTTDIQNRAKAITGRNQEPQTKYIYVDSGSGGGGGTYTPSNGGEDIIGKIKSLLEEQKRAADEYYKTMYEQQLSEINQQAEANRNSANLNYMRGDRYLRSMYGNNISGQGLSNRARNNSMWQNNLSSIRQNQANNQATAKSNYNTNLANSASQLAQGWYNYVLPYYSNEANQLRNIELQKYAMSL